MRGISLAAICLLAACTEPAVDPAGTAVRASSSSREAVGSTEVIFQDGSKVQVELMGDPATRAQGMMFRPSLSRDRGMLFLFPDKGQHAFWMKNTLISLDIVWIDENRTVVHIASEVPPCREEPCPVYAPEGHALYVLELAAGQAVERGVRIGDVLGFGGGIENIVAR